MNLTLLGLHLLQLKMRLNLFASWPVIKLNKSKETATNKMRVWCIGPEMFPCNMIPIVARVFKQAISDIFLNKARKSLLPQSYQK